MTYTIFHLLTQPEDFHQIEMFVKYHGVNKKMRDQLIIWT